MHGYIRQPTIHGDTIVFVSEDDLWTVPAAGGVARRLTAGHGAASGPRLSPDGALLAFTATEEGVAEVYVMPSEGGTPRRLTWLAANTTVAGWTPEGRVVISTDALSPFFRDNRLFAVDPFGGEPERLPYGLGLQVSFATDGKVAIGRHADDLARWKRYRGGRAGVIWAQSEPDGPFARPFDTDASHACPMWVGDRLFFLSDHAYDGNVWSCRPDGADLQQHTTHVGHFARHASSDGRRIVYTHAAGLWLLDAKGAREVPVDLRSPRTHLQRRFPDATRWLEDWDLHPLGHTLALTVRGRPVVLGAAEGPPVQLGEPQGARYRHARFLGPDRVVVVCDAGGEEAFEVHRVDGSEPPVRFAGLDIGRPIEVAVDPTGDLVAFSNHRYEVGVLDTSRGTVEVVDRSAHGRCEGLAWSADGAWLAYARPTSINDTAQIRVLDVRTRTAHDATDGRYRDLRPSFDPDGKYLWFLSYREFDPVYDGVYFDLGFPKAVRPYAAVLRADLASPFVREPKAPKAPEPPAAKDDEDTPATAIDFDGLSTRIVQFPVPEGRYERVIGGHGKVLLTHVPVRGGRAVDWRASGPPPAPATLSAFNLETGDLEDLVTDVTDLVVDARRKTMAYRSGARLRVLPIGKPPDAKVDKGRSWVDLSRAVVELDPVAEWRQMFRETWRLMRDHFWTEDMSGVDWPAMYDAYAPLLDRVGTRAEYSDLVWDLIGELGTSHAYEMLGDYRRPPSFRVGRLGAEVAWDEAAGAWRITRVVRGEPGDPDRSAPLADPGVDVRVDDVILAVGGVPVRPDAPPAALLASRAGQEVLLTVQRGGGARRTVRVRTLRDETPLRYRDWVIRNRERVHEASGGRVGYVHVPDMGPDGFAEFHRDYLVESTKVGLLVDVRFNRGGHVSQLLLEKLARRPIGFTVTRWDGGVHTYPAHTVLGPVVALTNEFAGSDGDIFSHNFKQMGLGPLVGTRTWGGVIGIWPRHRLVDGSLVTQPEFSNWYADVGWGLENRGTDPDIVVDMRPEDYAAGTDPQLDKAIEVTLSELDRRPVELPAFDRRPYLGRPR